MDLWTAILSIPHIGMAIPYLLSGIGICSALSTALPPPTTNGTVYWWTYSVINFIALNLGHAANASKPSSPPVGDSEHA